MLRHNDEAHSTSAVASIERAQKTKAPEAKVLGMSNVETPKIGSVSSSPAGGKSDHMGPMEAKKAPWGEGRELREMADKLGSILTAIERIGR